MESNPAAYRYRDVKKASDYGQYVVKYAGCDGAAKGAGVLSCMQESRLSSSPLLPPAPLRLSFPSFLPPRLPRN